MNKSLAMRLVVYIRAAGCEPVLPVKRDDWKTYAIRLQQQYQALCEQLCDSEKKSVRAIGRSAIKDLGLIEASDPFPLHLPDGRNVPKDLNQPTRAQRKLLELYPNNSHICPVCRSEAGRRKIAWHSRGLAELICTNARSNDPNMGVYECCVRAGMWHLGRGRRRKEQRSPVAEGNGRPTDLTGV